MKKVVHLICAARPNFMKIAPLYHALVKTDWCEPLIVHVRQHASDSMGLNFLSEFNIPLQNHLALAVEVGPGTHAEQTGTSMIMYEKACKSIPPDAIVVAGDVNATMACALVGVKLGVPVVHLEAGLRSFDRSMPEEINRVVTDSVSDLLLTPSQDADWNLDDEGRPDSVRVGNIMIDTFEMLRDKIEAVPQQVCGTPYAVVTLHRPSNVDNPSKLIMLLDQIRGLADVLHVVFPVHPRTRKHLPNHFIRSAAYSRITLLDPMSYVEFMALVKNATIVITDSGGVQEETSYLGVPCATVRENTERPITMTLGTNVLIKPGEIVESARYALRGDWQKGKPIPLWDGKTAGRCVIALHKFLNK